MFTDTMTVELVTETLQQTWVQQLIWEKLHEGVADFIRPKDVEDGSGNAGDNIGPCGELG